MDLDLPDRLHPARDLLGRSLGLHPRDQAPPMPAGLAAELMARFAESTAATRPASASWLEKVRGFFAAPGFGLAAAAAVVISVTVPMLTAPDVSGPDGIRGAEGPARNDTIRIAFIGENPQVESAVRASSNFEAHAFIADADSLPGPKVVIDFHQRTVTAYDATGDAVHRSSLPADPSATADVLAEAMLHL
jgi:hypothetical protein